MSQSVNPLSKWSLFGALVILLVAFWLRAADGAAVTHFRYDQAEMANMAMEMWNGDAFHWLGTPNSAGVSNSPLTIWIYLPALAISHSPQFITLYVALLNVVGVVLLWWIGHRYFSPSVGFIAGMLMAVAPWAINYSRAIWEPRTIMPLILLAIAVGLYGYLEKNRLAQVAFAPLLCIALQFHYVALTLLPLYLCVLYAGRVNINWKATLLSIVLGALTFVPFAIGLSQESSASTNTGERLGQIIDIWRAGPELRTYPINLTYELITGFSIFENILRDQSADFMQGQTRPDVVWHAIAVLAILGLPAALLRSSWRRYVPMLAVWALLTLLALIPAWTGSGVYHHHFAANLPVYFLLAALTIGLAVSSTVRALSLPRWTTGAVVGIIALVLFFSQGWIVKQAYQYWDTHYTVSASNGQTATPLHYLMDVREALQDYDDVIILGANPHESNFYVWKPMLYQSAQCVRDLLINDGQIDILPEGSFAVLVAPLNPINATYDVPPRYAHDDPQVMPLRPNEDPYIIYGFDSAPEWTETPITSVDSLPFQNGIRLTGYYLTDDTLQLRWHIERTPGDSYQYFAHFLDASGNRIGQRDAPFYSGRQWCDGDTLITTVSVNLPTETATLRVGMYAIDDAGKVVGQSLVNDEGQFTGQWLDIPLE